MFREMKNSLESLLWDSQKSQSELKVSQLIRATVPDSCAFSGWLPSYLLQYLVLICIPVPV